MISNNGIMNRSISRYDDLNDYCEKNPGLKLKWIAEQIGVEDPARFSKLKDPKKYASITPSAEEIRDIARLINQSEDYVRKLYPNAA